MGQCCHDTKVSIWAQVRYASVLGKGNRTKIMTLSDLQPHMFIVFIQKIADLCNKRFYSRKFMEFLTGYLLKLLLLYYSLNRFLAASENCGRDWVLFL